MPFLNLDTPEAKEVIADVFGDSVTIEKLNDDKFQNLFKAKHETELAGLVRKRDELLAEVKQLKVSKTELDDMTEKFKDVDPEEYRQLKASDGKPGTEELQNKVNALDAQVKQLQKERDALKAVSKEHQELAEQRLKQNNEMMIGQDILRAIDSINIKNPDAGVIDGASKYLRQLALGVFRREEDASVPYKHDAPMYGPSGTKMTPAEWLDSLRDGEDSWVFKKPAGGGASGGGSGGATKKKWGDMSESDRVALFRENPALFNKMRDEAESK